MCGISVYSGVENADKLKLKMLMLANITRGDKGTGMYDGKIIKKDSVDAIEFFGENDIINTKLFIGHTRQPTYASNAANNKAENCHPFQYGNIVMVHNGTINNQYDLCEKYKIKYTDYVVDSQIIAKCLSVDDNYSVLQNLSGTATVVFCDKRKPKSIFCYRLNDQRPLFYGMDGGGMYMSSIEKSLQMIGCSDIDEFDTECLYEISDGKIINTTQMKAIKKPYYKSNDTASAKAATSARLLSGDIVVRNTPSGYPLSDRIYKVGPMPYDTGSNCFKIDEMLPIDGLMELRPKYNANYLTWQGINDVERIDINSIATYRAGSIGFTVMRTTIKSGQYKGLVVPAGTPIICLSKRDTNAGTVTILLLKGDECLIATYHTCYLAFFQTESKMAEDIRRDVEDEFKFYMANGNTTEDDGDDIPASVQSMVEIAKRITGATKTDESEDSTETQVATEDASDRSIEKTTDEDEMFDELGLIKPEFVNQNWLLYGDQTISAENYMKLYNAYMQLGEIITEKSLTKAVLLTKMEDIYNEMSSVVEEFSATLDEQIIETQAAFRK